MEGKYFPFRQNPACTRAHTHTDNVVKEKYTMEELLRKHVQGTLTPDPSSATLPPHLPGGKVVWPPLPQPEVVKNGEKFVSRKCTTAHETVIKERDAVFEVSGFLTT